MARSIKVEVLGDSSSLVRAFNRSSNAARGWNGDMARASRGALVATVGFRGLGRSIAFASAAFVGGAGLGAAVKSSIEGFTKFEDTMQKTIGLANVAQSQVGGFSKQILNLAAAVGKSPQELAQGFYFIASSGIAASKAMNVLREASKASIAGLGQTEVVADALTSVLNAYGQSNISAAQAADVLVAAVREGKGEADRFAPVIGNVVALASQLGVSFNEVGAALAAQTRLGTDAETTAIQLQRVFSTLLKVTPKSAEAFANVGLSADKLREDLGSRGLLFVLKEVKAAFAGNPVDLANAFGDVRALRGILNLVGKQSDQVVGVFNRMKDSAGSAKTAFDAVSKDTAQQFRRLRASAEVAGIAIGAVFAPLAAKVANALTGVTTEVTTLFNKLGRAKGLKAKLHVVVDEGKNIQKSIQEQLDKVDFGVVGRRVGAGIIAGVKFAVPAAKQLAAKINDALTSIDFVKVGKAMGPGLAAAMATAFVTLLDPSFWLHNWQLALAVAIAAFPVGRLGGAIGKLFAKPFLKLGEVLAPLAEKAVSRVSVKLVEGLLRISERLAGLVADLGDRLSRTLARALANLPQTLLRLLSPLTKIVEKVFGRLGTKARFVLRVLGIQAAINVVVQFGKKVVQVISGAVKTVGRVFSELWKDIEIKALKAALKIVEPFTHIPKKLGGGAFQNLKDHWQQMLANLESDTKESAKKIQASIDGIHGKDVSVTITTSFVNGAGAGDAGGADSARKQVKARAKAEEDAAIQAAIARGKAAKAAARAAAQAKAAKEKAVKAFAEIMDSFLLAEEEATATKSLRDDISVQKSVQAAILAEIKIEGKTTELQRQLFESRQKVADFERQIRENKAAAKKRNQFLALGLTGEGDERIPSAGALLKKAKSLREQLKGTPLDTTKTVAELTRIAKVLTGKFGAVGRDVRQAILQMLQDINSALEDKKGKGPLTKFRVANFSNIANQFPDLSSEDAAKLKRILARIGPGGTTAQGSRIGGAFSLPPTGGSGNFNINGPVTIVVEHGTAEEIQRALQKKRRRTATSRTGSRAGNGIGV